MLDHPDLDIAHLFSPRLRPLAEAVASAADDPTRDSALDSAFVEVMHELRLGSPFTFAEQYGGALVQNARPAQGHEREQSSRGRVALNPHTDDAFLDPGARPEHLALLGVANPAAIPTEVVRIDDVISLLDREAIVGLSVPAFHFPLPQSFDAGGGDPELPARPILLGGGDLPAVSLAPDTRVAPGADESAGRHLCALEAAVAAAPRLRFALGPGEVLLVSNSRCLHGRPPAAAGRWLKRLYLRRDFGHLDKAARTERANVYSATRAT